MSKKKKVNTWGNAIVGRQMLPVGDITPHTENWRIHPPGQRVAMNDMLGTVGWVTGVIFNKTTGNLLDGHMRLEEAIKNGELEIPATIVEMSAEQELKVLAFIDATTNEAVHDQDMLDELNIEMDAMRDSLVALLEDSHDVVQDAQSGAEVMADLIEKSHDLPERSSSWAFGHIFIHVPFKDYVDFREALYQEVGFKRIEVIHELMERLGVPQEKYRVS